MHMYHMARWPAICIIRITVGAGGRETEREKKKKKKKDTRKESPVTVTSFSPAAALSY